MKLLGFHREEVIQRPADGVDTEGSNLSNNPEGGPLSYWKRQGLHRSQQRYIHTKRFIGEGRGIINVESWQTPCWGANTQCECIKDRPHLIEPGIIDWLFVMKLQIITYKIRTNLVFNLL